jgi:urate oxidase
MKLIQHQYGKARVRVLKVTRKGARHSIKELEVAVGLEGDFGDSFIKADNRLVVATDTMKNTVNVLAREKLGTETEEFGVILGKHFLKNYPQVSRVEIHLSEHCWERLRIEGRDHAHAFAEKGAARPFARIVGTKIGERVETVVESGIEDLLILKSSGSGFEKFLHDKYTTLAETGDRILATRLKASWTYARTPKRFSATNARILDAMLEVFANNYSPSVQVTLFQMGEAALAAAPEISQIRLTLPNQHCLLINLAPFGLENKNELFVPTDEPHGQIEGTVSR